VSCFIVVFQQPMVSRGQHTGRPIQRRIWAAALALLGGILPILVIIPVVFYEAQRQADGAAAATSGVIRNQIDNILMRAQDATQTLAGMLDRPCADVLDSLRHTDAVLPYSRSLALVRDNTVYCSSINGPEHQSLPVVAAGAEIRPGLQVEPVSGTWMVPDRPAVLVTVGVRPGTGSVVIIDSQHLFDLMAAAAGNGMYDIEILLGKQRMVLQEAGERMREPNPVTARTQISASAAFPVEVRVAVMDHQAHVFRQHIWRGYLAFLVLACLLCGYGAYKLYGQHISLPMEMRKGMRRGAFHLAYQPVVDLATGQFSGVEALLRWQHPRLGSLRPDMFIPVAEEHGVIGDLTRHIFDLAANDLPVLDLPPGSHLGINVCGAHMAEAGFARDVESLLERMRSHAPLILVLEVTEREALPDSPQIRGHMESLRAHGVRWAIDDFGTGHSSLAYLERLNADYLKIDRAFVNSVGTGAITTVVLDTVIELAKRLGLEMIAEGVETPEQEAHLRDHGVQLAQGYRYAAPMRARDLTRWRKTLTSV
jgi:sensor c-di-GMP phosphodiesterase-like protein